METPSKEDIAADFKRNRGLRFSLAGALWMMVFYLSYNRLHDATVQGNARLFWALLPVPFFILGFWGWGVGERMGDELTRRISDEASAFAFRFTIFWLFGLALVDAAIGLPHRDPAGDLFGWKEAAIFPLFAWGFGFFRAHRKYFPQPGQAAVLTVSDYVAGSVRKQPPSE